MAQRQITELDTATTPDGSELLLVRQSTEDKKLEIDSLLTYLQGQFDDRYLNEDSNLLDISDASTGFDNIKQYATTDYSGVVELATTTEAVDGSSSTLAVTPAGLYAAILSNVPSASYTVSGKVELATPTETKTGEDSTRAVTPEGIKAILDDMFCGQVASFAMGAAPEGWLKCDGSAVSRTTYAKLFAKVGTRYGSGDGSTTFNVPDLRGEFVRGYDDTRGVDSGRTLGSWQDDQSNRLYQVRSYRDSSSQSYSGSTVTIPEDGSESSALRTGGMDGDGDNHNFKHHYKLTGSETRPRNVSLLYCIKY